MSLSKIASLVAGALVLLFFIGWIVIDRHGPEPVEQAGSAPVENDSTAAMGESEAQGSTGEAAQPVAPSRDKNEAETAEAGDSTPSHPEPDWSTVEDVDALIAELTERYEDGDAAAGGLGIRGTG